MLDRHPLMQALSEFNEYLPKDALVPASAKTPAIQSGELPKRHPKLDFLSEKETKNPVCRPAPAVTMTTKDLEKSRRKALESFTQYNRDPAHSHLPPGARMLLEATTLSFAAVVHNEYRETDAGQYRRPATQSANGNQRRAIVSVRIPGIPRKIRLLAELHQTDAVFTDTRTGLRHKLVSYKETENGLAVTAYIVKPYVNLLNYGGARRSYYGESDSDSDQNTSDNEDAYSYRRPAGYPDSNDAIYVDENTDAGEEPDRSYVPVGYQPYVPVGYPEVDPVAPDDGEEYVAPEADDGYLPPLPAEPPALPYPPELPPTYGNGGLIDGVPRGAWRPPAFAFGPGIGGALPPDSYLYPDHYPFEMIPGEPRTQDAYRYKPLNPDGEDFTPPGQGGEQFADEKGTVWWTATPGTAYTHYWDGMGWVKYRPRET